MDLSPLRLHLPDVGRNLWRSHEPGDGRVQFDERRRAHDHHVQRGGRGDAIPLPLQDEVPLYQPPAPAECGTGSGGLQFSHHVDRFGSRDVHSRLHRRLLQALRHLRVYEQHSVVDDLQARFHHLLPPALLHRFGKHVPIALDYRTSDLHLSGLAHHQLGDDGSPAPGGTYRLRYYPRFPLHEAAAFISLDYLGCILWSAWMLEFIFFFTYGEHYNWLDSKIMQMDVLLFIFTGYFCIQRMFHIRHPYIEPAAWKYKRLIPLLILFAFVEFMGSTPKVLQTTFTGGVLHFGNITTNVLNFVEWTGAIAGCLFCLFWCKVLHQKYTRLLTIGVATMVCYPVMMYFLIDPGLNIEALYLPCFLRSFGNAIFFCMLTVYLEELMPFQHFFMGLTMAGIIRNGPMSAMCSGLYSFGLRYQMADNMSRGLPYDATNLLMLSIRNLYGITCLIGIAVLIIFLLWDVQPVRSTLKKMPSWNFVGKRMKKKKGFAK